MHARADRRRASAAPSPHTYNTCQTISIVKKLCCVRGDAAAAQGREGAEPCGTELGEARNDVAHCGVVAQRKTAAAGRPRRGGVAASCAQAISGHGVANPIRPFQEFDLEEFLSARLHTLTGTYNNELISQYLTRLTCTCQELPSDLISSKKGLSRRNSHRNLGVRSAENSDAL